MVKGSMREVLMGALRLFGYSVAFGFIGFMFVPALMGASDALRMPLVGILIIAAGFLFYSEGSYRGERDCAMSETLDKLEAKGDYKATDAENGKRFARIKGVLSALIGAAPVVIMAIIVAITAKPYVYTLQDLPAWLTPYLDRPEVGGALDYMQLDAVRATVTDYLRIAVRFLLFPYIGFLGTLTDDMSLIFDRVSPLLALLMPALSAIGYQFGPQRRKKAVEMVEKAKNTPRRRLKKDRKRNQGPQEKKQLI